MKKYKSTYIFITKFLMDYQHYTHKQYMEVSWFKIFKHAHTLNLKEKNQIDQPFSQSISSIVQSGSNWPKTTSTNINMKLSTFFTQTSADNIKSLGTVRNKQRSKMMLHVLPLNSETQFVHSVLALSRSPLPKYTHVT